MGRVGNSGADGALTEPELHRLNQHAFRTCRISSSIRSLNCAAPQAASKLAPEAPEGWLASAPEELLGESGGAETARESTM
eukprot:8590712-Alexandrium_andersonii.AAC.1